MSIFRTATASPHHVYSFSAAKTFELQLYKGDAHPPVVFDQPGLVQLACNIHDGMRAYVLVTAAPYFAGGDQPALKLAPGRYRIEVWHPEQVEGLVVEREIADRDIALEFAVREQRRIVRGLGNWKAARR